MKGESSNSKWKAFDGGIYYKQDDNGVKFFCGICENELKFSNTFYVIGCNHSLCFACVAMYVDFNLQNNISNINCPAIGCERKLGPQHCRSVLPPQMFDRWTGDICKGLVTKSSGKLYYCPYEDCASLLKDNDDDDSRGGGTGTMMVLQSECRDCRRLFCARCEVPWHSKLSCEEYQKYTFVCDICVEKKPMLAGFRVADCNHSYCSDCVAKYVGSKLQENVSDIECPNVECNEKLGLEHCSSILPREVFDKWSDALCEALIMSSSEKFYCPFKDCSVLLINDSNETTEAECPDCHRLFCAKCKVAWHSEVSCEEYQKLDMNDREREDIMLMKLAKDNNWKRCPKCRFYVERSEGCLFMTCRCNCTFCYQCGVVSKDHYCQNCKH